MKKMIVVLLLMGMLAFASSGTSNIKNALNELESTAKGFLAFASIALIAGGAMLSAICIFIYYNKLKDKEDRSALWMAAAVITGGFGFVSLLGGIIGLILYLLIPAMIESMIAA